MAFLAALPELGPGAQVNGRVDRLAVTDSEVLILDYKTNRPPPAREADVSPVYLAADGALPRSRSPGFSRTGESSARLIWTDGPRLMRLTDAILDRQMAMIRHRLDPEGAHS